MFNQSISTMLSRKNAGRAMVFLFLGTLLACESSQGDAKAEIKAIMDKQVLAWNKGDLEGFMDGYWNNDSLVFTGGKRATYGWEPALRNYQKSYATPEQMGKLVFGQVESKVIGPTSVFSVGQWILERKSDTLSGRFTLVWKRIDGRWKIIADHSS